MNFEELKTKSEKELLDLLSEQKALLHAKKMKVRMGSFKQTHELKEAKRSIARIQTLLKTPKA
jgi:ribosomal protein L29